MTTPPKRPTLAELRKEAERCGHDVLIVRGAPIRVVVSNGTGSVAVFTGHERMSMALTLLRALPDWRKP